MKVLLINGSPKEHGNTFQALSEVANTLNAEGIETEIISIGKGKAAIEREQSQACLGSAERKQARPKVKAEVFANAIKHDFRSKNPTTRWSDIIKLK